MTAITSVIVIVVLAMIGVALVVAYLVSRVRALSRYYGQKLP